MRKGIRYLILLTIIFLPIKTYAAGVSISLSCPSKANVNETISCNVNVNTGTKVNGIAAKLNLGSAFSYVSFTPTNGFTAYYNSKAGFSIGNNSGKSGQYTVGVLKLKVLKAGSFTVNRFDVSDTSGKAYTPSNVSKSVTIKSKENNLSALSITGQKLSPNFSPNTTSYSLTVDDKVTSININATKKDNSATLTGTGKKTVNYGKNTYTITVTSESGAKKVYTIIVNKPDNRNKNNNLKSLSLTGYDLDFDKNNLNYNLTVNTDVSFIDVKTEVEDNKAKLVNNYGSRQVKLNYGNNKIQVKVQAENTEVKTYTINVKRLTEDEIPSDNTNIKSFSIPGHEINFSNDTKDYTVEINDEYALVFNIELEDPKSTYKIENNEDLKEGSIITLTVRSESGKEVKYNFNIKKNVKNTKCNEDNNINITYIVLSFISGIIIGFIIGFIVKKNKPINNIN